MAMSEIRCRVCTLLPLPEPLCHGLIVGRPGDLPTFVGAAENLVSLQNFSDSVFLGSCPSSVRPVWPVPSRRSAAPWRPCAESTSPSAPARSSGSSARTAPGKTTTLRMLTTLLPPTGGAATVAGHDLATDPAGVRRACGYVAQSGGVDPQITVREELVTQGRLYRLTKNQAVARAAELARDLDLTELAGPQVRRALRRPAAPPRHRDGAHPPPPGPLPRRADDGTRPRQPRRSVGAGPAAARRARHHGLPDHALPRRGGRARRPDGRSSTRAWSWRTAPRARSSCGTAARSTPRSRTPSWPSPAAGPPPPTPPP